MNIFKINPYIRVAIPSVLPPNFFIKRRIIFDYELIYVEKGKFILSYDDKDFECKKGQFILIRPGVPHSFKGVGEELSQPHIHFDFFYTLKSEEIPVSFKDFDELSPTEKSYISEDVFEKYPKKPFVSFSDKDKFLKLFYKIVLSKRSLSPLLEKSIMTEIIDMLLSENFPDCFSASLENKYNIAQQLKDYIDAGQGINLSLSDLEGQFAYSKFYLERQFKKLYGISLISYRNNKKLDLARTLLKTESVSAVAEKTGYNSIYSFSRAFKQHFGICPSEIK